MLTLIRDGGFSMWFILAFGAVTLVTAFLFAVRPAEVHQRFIRWMALSTLFSVLGGVATDLATTFYTVSGDKVPDELRTRMAMRGVAESMAPAIVGFAMLSLVALMVAVGKRRLDHGRAR